MIKQRKGREDAQHYMVKTISLASARTNEKLAVHGDTIYVLSIDGSVTIRLNSPQSDELDLRELGEIKSPFTCFYMTNTAQTGKSVKLAIGGEASFGGVKSEVGVKAGIGVWNGQQNVASAGTRVQITSHSPLLSLTVKAKPTNTGLIYVGDSAVSSSNGFILSAGDSISLDIADSDFAYIDSSVDGEGVCYIGVEKA